MKYALIRLPVVLDRRGVKRTTHYEQIIDGTMTPPVAIGGRAVAWPESEIDAINAARVAGKDDSFIRELVKRLVSKRAQALEGIAI